MVWVVILFGTSFLIMGYGVLARLGLGRSIEILYSRIILHLTSFAVRENQLNRMIR